MTVDKPNFTHGFVIKSVEGGEVPRAFTVYRCDRGYTYIKMVTEWPDRDHLITNISFTPEGFEMLLKAVNTAAFDMDAFPRPIAEKEAA